MTGNRDHYRCPISTNSRTSDSKHVFTNTPLVIHLCNCGLRTSCTEVCFRKHTCWTQKLMWMFSSSHGCLGEWIHNILYTTILMVLDLLHQKYWFCRHDFLVLVRCLQVSRTIHDQCWSPEIQQQIQNPSAGKFCDVRRMLMAWVCNSSCMQL
jgi:hypothetical protein